MALKTFLPLLLAALALSQDRVRVAPPDNGAALVNPGMGWVFHHYDNSIKAYGRDLAPSDTLDDFPGLSTVYLRLAWAFVEPEEGKFNWSIIDTPAQRWVAKGKRVALRISCSETDAELPFATPKWVKDAGAKGYFFTPGKGVDPAGKLWEPDFDDPVFLSKLDRFLAAFAKRYDGNPEIDFIDVASFGVWGEGHTFWSTRRNYSAATIRTHLELHRKHFHHTLLAANDDFANQGRGQAGIDAARDLGFTLRDDSIMVQPGDKAYFHAAMAHDFWPRLPVILESEHYGISVKNGAWGDGSKYIQALEEYHASYASIHWYAREFLENNRDLVRRMNLRLGYRLQLTEASWPAAVSREGALPVQWSWRNAGVAPCLPGGFPALTLKDDKGGIAAVFVDETLDFRTLQAAKSSTQPEFRLPVILNPGTYDVFVSAGSRTGTPRLALPLEHDDGHHRYRLGQFQVR